MTRFYYSVTLGDDIAIDQVGVVQDAGDLQFIVHQ